MRKLFYILIIVLVASCKLGPPRGVMSQRQMVDVLYQYHIAMSMAAGSDSSDIKARAYVLASLRENGLTEAEFDSSLVWYAQHTDKLYEVYRKVDERLENDLASLGAATNEVDRYSTLDSKGDTANIWNGKSYYMLSGNGFNNRFTFEIKADTSFKPNDEYMLNFRAQFLQREGSKHGVVSIAIQYDNDSVNHVEQHFYGGGDNSVRIQAANRKIRRIYGFMYMISEWREKPYYLFIFNPSLIRFRQPQTEPEVQDTKPDSAQVVTTSADSAKKAEPTSVSTTNNTTPTTTPPPVKQPVTPPAKQPVAPTAKPLLPRKGPDTTRQRNKLQPVAIPSQKTISAEEMHSRPQPRR